MKWRQIDQKHPTKIQIVRKKEKLKVDELQFGARARGGGGGGGGAQNSLSSAIHVGIPHDLTRAHREKLLAKLFKTHQIVVFAMKQFGIVYVPVSLARCCDGTTIPIAKASEFTRRVQVGPLSQGNNPGVLVRDLLRCGQVMAEFEGLGQVVGDTIRGLKQEQDVVRRGALGGLSEHPCGVCRCGPIELWEHGAAESSYVSLQLRFEGLQLWLEGWVVGLCLYAIVEQEFFYNVGVQGLYSCFDSWWFGCMVDPGLDVARDEVVARQHAKLATQRRSVQDSRTL